MAAPCNNFTKEQIVILKANPNVAMVNSVRVFFTAEFKERFWTLYKKEYMRPRDILEELGISTKILGNARIRGIAQNISKEYAMYGKFNDSRKPNAPGAKSKPNDRDVLSSEEEMKRLRAENEYLKQELEFVKKIVAAGERGRR
jgi:transposase-like protein